jgi:uncharacterized protein YdaU (DUF1376 family)
MAKDPATLWYWNDWQGGTSTLTRHLKGCYMDLLHAQFNSGRLSLAQIKTVLGADFGAAWPDLQEKFTKDDSGKFYNQRAEDEKLKRSKYSESRRSNRQKKPPDGSYVNHMIGHMENRNENEISISEQIQLSEKLLVDAGFFQTLAMNWSIDRKGFESMVQAFEVNLNILNKRHPNYQEYKSHFFNWGVKKFQEYKSKPDRYASFRK